MFLVVFFYIFWLCLECCMMDLLTWIWLKISRHLVLDSCCLFSLCMVFEIDFRVCIFVFFFCMHARAIFRKSFSILIVCFFWIVSEKKIMFLFGQYWSLRNEVGVERIGASGEKFYDIWAQRVYPDRFKTHRERDKRYRKKEREKNKIPSEIKLICSAWMFLFFVWLFWCYI